MRMAILLGGAALALTSAWALAQDAPESLLPPGFDDPAPVRAPAPSPAPTPSPTPAPSGSAPRPGSAPVVQSVPGPSGVSDEATAAVAPDAEFLAKLPSLEELEEMSPEELEDALGLSPGFDIPAAARRSLKQVGVIDQREGGFAATSFSRQNASLVRAMLAGNRGRLVSRWGHILLRRALASRLDAPKGMNPADFAALRASLLVRMGEVEAARAIVQDVDPRNYTPTLTDAAFDTYIANADFTGICPAMMTHGSKREDPQWKAASSICSAFRGDGNYALRRLDRAIKDKAMPKIDLLLAQKYAGAAGKARRAVAIEWEGVNDMTPWRYGLTIAVGLVPPERLMKETGRRYAGTAALAPMLGLADRADAADRAGGMGVLSSAAMVDLYSQIYVNEDINGPLEGRADKLRDAYTLAEPVARLLAMQELWTEAEGPLEQYSRQVLTAYAAARMPVDADLRESAPALIASMLTAGLDQNAMRWADVAEAGSEAWALLALAAEKRTSSVDAETLDTFFDDDESVELRKSAFLLAGLAGLDRISAKTKASFEGRLDIDLDRESHWTSLIDTAVERRNPGLVALLATLGMQGTSWDKMTPRYLFHIVSGLRRAGLEAEARMIAAEAVARG